MLRVVYHAVYTHQGTSCITILKPSRGMVLRRMLHVSHPYIETCERLPMTFILYSEATSSRALNSASYTDTTAMTDESCINFCNGKGYNMAGTEYSQECCE